MEILGVCMLILAIGCFRMGKFLAEWNQEQKKKYAHKCHPHMCNHHAQSVACYVDELGDFWVKEYRNGDHALSEGRTYQVNYCPFCGAKGGGKRNVRCD